MPGGDPRTAAVDLTGSCLLPRASQTAARAPGNSRPYRVRAADAPNYEFPLSELASSRYGRRPAGTFPGGVFKGLGCAFP